MYMCSHKVCAYIIHKAMIGKYSIIVIDATRDITIISNTFVVIG